MFLFLLSSSNAHYLLFLLSVVIIFLSKQRVSDVSLLTSRVPAFSFHRYTWMRMLTTISYLIVCLIFGVYGLFRKLFINLLASQFRFFVQVELMQGCTPYQMFVM